MIHYVEVMIVGFTSGAVGVFVGARVVAKAMSHMIRMTLERIDQLR